MRPNNANTADIISGMENAAMKMQPEVRPTNRRLPPYGAEEMTDYVECLLDIREECSLSAEEACRIAAQEPSVYDGEAG